jgi:hypothetical protein
VGYLCSERAQAITGQLMGVRGKEIFLFNQPEPQRSLLSKEDWTVETISHAVENSWLKKGLTPLLSDLEIFNYPPFV